MVKLTDKIGCLATTIRHICGRIIKLVKESHSLLAPIFIFLVLGCIKVIKGKKIGLLILFFIISLFFIKEDAPIGYSCYYEKAVLLNQYIDYTNYTGGGDCKSGCLFMDVYTEHIYFFDCGHIEKILWENRTYYFANERIREDLKEGDTIQVKWCYVSEDIGRRIRGINKWR